MVSRAACSADGGHVRLSWSRANWHGRSSEYVTSFTYHSGDYTTDYLSSAVVLAIEKVEEDMKTKGLFGKQ